MFIQSWSREGTIPWKVWAVLPRFCIMLLRQHLRSFLRTSKPSAWNGSLTSTFILFKWSNWRTWVILWPLSCIPFSHIQKRLVLMSRCSWENPVYLKCCNHTSVLKKGPQIHADFRNNLLKQVYLFAVQSFQNPFSNRVLKIDRAAHSATEALL